MYSERGHRLQLCKLPPDRREHFCVRLLELRELHLGLDEREEHAELRAPEALEEAAEDVVVVEEVLARLGPVRLEGALELLEVPVEVRNQRGTRDWRSDPGDPEDDLQPLLDVELHVQRSEYRADCIFVDNGVAAVAEPLSNL